MHRRLLFPLILALPFCSMAIASSIPVADQSASHTDHKALYATINSSGSASTSTGWLSGSTSVQAARDKALLASVRNSAMTSNRLPMVGGPRQYVRCYAGPALPTPEPGTLLLLSGGLLGLSGAFRRKFVCN